MLYVAVEALCVALLSCTVPDSVTITYTIFRGNVISGAQRLETIRKNIGRYESFLVCIDESALQ